MAGVLLSTGRGWCVLICVGLTLLWLGALFLFPSGWADPHGNKQLLCIIAVSGLHLICGAGLLIAAASCVIRARLAAVVLLAPAFHLVGSVVEGPPCLLLLVGPSLAILAAGYHDLRRPPSGSS